jgi:hypothetical protein
MSIMKSEDRTSIAPRLWSTGQQPVGWLGSSHGMIETLSHERSRKTSY